jgi:hypothetical protein
LEDVKTTGKMKNMMQGWCTEPVSTPVRSFAGKRSKHRRSYWKMKNHRQGIAGGSGGSL